MLETVGELHVTAYFSQGYFSFSHSFLFVSWFWLEGNVKILQKRLLVQHL